MAMYDLWSPERFVDGTTMSGHLGAKVSVWCDDPNAKSESQIAAALGDRLRVMAQQTWGSPKPLLYLGFIPVMKAVGIAPT
jgi:hexosaminidase